MVEKLSIVNMKEGAAVEQIDLAIADIIKDLNDPNKNDEKTREIVIKLKFIPEKDRTVRFACETTTKLAPKWPVLGFANHGMENGRVPKAFEFGRGEQMKLNIEVPTPLKQVK